MKVVPIAIVAILAIAEAKVTKFTRCEDVSQDECTVQEVRIDPCNSYPCKLKMGNNYDTEVDGTPHFSAKKTKFAIYLVGPLGMVPIDSMGVVDGCQHTRCPLQSGKQNTLSYTLSVPKNVIAGTYTFRCELWNAAKTSEVCCFETRAQIVS